MEARLADIRNGQAREILERHDEKHRAKETWCVGVRWDICEPQDLVEIVEVGFSVAVGIDSRILNAFSVFVVPRG